jgi:DNA repair protein SbcD/Mre11
MIRRPPRFVHSSDWHLERPLGGLAEIPDRLKATFIDAPYLAAARVVDTALAEDADFLVLSGDLLDVELAGPHGVAFLLEQFSRLRERQISVYWAAGRVDRPTRWPASIKLPDNVRLFSQRRPEAVVHQREAVPLARIVGISRHRKRATPFNGFSADADGLPTIGVAHGPFDRAALAGRPLSYWAMGGKHGRTTIAEGPPAAHYAGSPQARAANESGSHGCTVVELDSELDGDLHGEVAGGRASMRFVPTDVVRWSPQPVTIDQTTTRESLRHLLAERLATLAGGASSSEWLVSFDVSGHGPLTAALRHGAWPRQLLAELRSHAPANVWPMSIELDPAAAVPPAWFEQDSLLGDYLRSLGDLGAEGDGHGGEGQGGEGQGGEGLGVAARLASYLDEPRRAGEIGRLVAVTDSADRLRVLRQSAALAADWLGGQEVGS